MSKVERDALGRSKTEKALEVAEINAEAARAQAAIENLIGTEAYDKIMDGMAAKKAEPAEKGYRPTIWINIHKSFARIGLVREDGSTFDAVTVPKGTTIGGRDIGGATFYPLFPQTNKFNPNLVSIPLLEDSDAYLYLPIKDEEGNVTGTEKLVVKNTELKAAIDAQNKAYYEQKKQSREKDKEQPKEPAKEEKKEQPKEYKSKVWINLNKAFAHRDLKTEDGSTFNGVNLPKGTMIGGADMGGASFYPEHIQDNPRNPKLASIPLDEDGKTVLSLPLKDQEGKVVSHTKVTVDNKDLKAAVDEQIKHYYETHRRETKDRPKSEEKAETKAEDDRQRLSLDEKIRIASAKL